MSHRCRDAECKWDTGYQVLLSFMNALRECSVYQQGRSFLLRTDHKPLRYLQSKAPLSGRQYRWIDTLQEYSYQVEHVPGKR